MDYEELLERAKKHIPTTISVRKRFEMPTVNSFIQGNRTIIVNFTNIANYLNREPRHLLKYFLRELATSGDIESGRAVFIGKFKKEFLQKKLESYVETFVRCKECKSYDTRVEKEDSYLILKCMACQAKRPLPKIK